MEKELQKNISYRLRFINKTRFTASTLSNLADNLAEGIHEIKCTNCNICNLEYTNVQDNLIECKCLCCNKNYQKRFHEILIKKFANTYIFAKHHISKFVLLLQKALPI